LNNIIANEYKGYLANLLNIKSYHIVLGQTDISNNEINIKSELTKADEKFLKTLIEKPDYMDILFGNVDYEAFDNKYFRAFFENENEDILRSIKIRDDIVIYNEQDFLHACKIKQKKYLENELKKLAQSFDEDIFLKMDNLRKKLDNLK